MTAVIPVPFDPEVGNALAQFPPSPPLSADSITQSRQGMSMMLLPPAEVIGDRPVDYEDIAIPGGLTVTVLRPRGGTERAPAVYNMHGGGLIMGSRHMDTPRLVDMVVEFGLVAVNIDYRLAPENPGQGPAEDCYAGLLWTAEHADELGLDPDRIIVMGGSAGGNLAASMALLSRDRGGPDLLGQLLLVPMLDDRNETVSSYQFDGIGTWDRNSNLVAWRAVLGERMGGPDVSPYIAPARAADLSGLPPAYIELGSAELFRDESVEYATRLWAAGVDTELHVWSGGCHGFDIFVPDCSLTEAALAARRSWVRRQLSRG